MKEKIINEIFWLNSIEKSKFIQHYSLLYDVNNFDDFYVLYKNIEKWINDFFLKYKNKNNINKIPKIFEMLFYWYFVEKWYDKKMFNLFKKEISSSYIDNSKKYISIYDILLTINDIKEWKKFSWELYNNYIKDYLKVKQIYDKESIEKFFNTNDIEKFLLNLKDYLEKVNENFIVIIDEEALVKVVFEQYMFLKTKIIKDN